MAASTKRTVEVLLESAGRTFAEELGMRMADRPEPLFRLLVFSLMASARIRTTNAVSGARALFERGWTTPRDYVRTRWEQKVRVLNRHGYARYDERTSGMLYDSARLALERYGGDLRGLRAEAGRDPAVERRLLKEFKGIGDVGVNIFFREAQRAWPELYPFADDRVLESAAKLGLPRDTRRLARLVEPDEFPRLVAALMRVRLQRDRSEVLRRASAA